MIRLTPAVEAAVAAASVGGATLLSAIDGSPNFITQLIDTWGPWGFIAVGAGLLLKLLVTEIRDSQKAILEALEKMKRNQVRVLDYLQMEDEYEEDDKS